MTTGQMSSQGRVWQDDLDRHGRVEFHLAKRRVWLMLVLAIMISGLFSAIASSDSSPSEPLVWGAGAALGAAGVVFFGAQLLSKRVPVVVDADGVHVEWTWGPGMSVRWSAIENAIVHQNRGSSMASLVVSRDFERDWLATRSGPLKALAAVQRTFYGASLLALPFPLTADADDLAGWLRKQARQRSGRGGSNSVAPHESVVGPVADWPDAVARPAICPDPDAAFEAEGAERSAVGVLQWTSALLVDGGRGPGCWDFVDLRDWATGEISHVVSELGSRETQAFELALAVGDVLDRAIRLAPSTWVFSPDDGFHRWIAPLFVVHATE